MRRTWLVGFALVACTAKDYAQLYQDAARAPSLDAGSIADLKFLGPTVIDQGTNFGVYSERATRVQLLLFDDPEATLPSQTFELQRFGDVWNVYIEGIGYGQHYGYAAWGPNWPYDPAWYPGSIYGFLADVDTEGNRFNPNKLLTDPYARAVHRDHDWSKGSTASGPGRTDSTYDAASKSVVIRSTYTWSAADTAYRASRRNADAPGHRFQDLILYEVHLKGFTASPASAVEHPATYRGLAEKADYLADLGITAVELMPVFEKPLDGGYWGYQTLNFFAPELSYASSVEFTKVTDEFKAMVDALHQRDIEVILDVVYNHTGEGGLWREKIEQDDVSLDPTTDAQLINFHPKEVAGLYSYRGLDNAGYYALAPDGASYWNNTGVGNETRCNHRPMRRLILDSLRYWVDEMHVDGFRFDLAPILGEVDGDYNTWDDPAATVLQDIIDDPVLRDNNVRIIAEPWSLQHFKLGAFPASTDDTRVAWYEWNGNFRDVWRSFTNFDDRRLSSAEGPIDIGAALTGSYALFGTSARRPYHSVNFVSVHDGFTLYDLFSFNEKRNGCGLLNPTCCDERYSPFCELESGETYNRSKDWGEQNEALKRQLMRNMFVYLMVSHGTPMLLGGDEWMRTQFGNNNAYSTRADNSWNWFDWGTWQPNAERNRMHDFVRSLIQLRKDHAYALAPASYETAAPIGWKNAQNQDMQPTDWQQQRHLMLHYWDVSLGPELVILINQESSWTTFTLPTDRTWVRLVDTQSYLDTTPVVDANPLRSANLELVAPAKVTAATYAAAPRSVVILEAQ